MAETIILPKKSKGKDENCISFQGLKSWKCNIAAFINVYDWAKSMYICQHPPVPMENTHV